VNTTEAGIRATHDAILNLQLALLGIFEEKEKYHHGYAVMAEGIVSEILRLRNEIDDRIGLTEFVGEGGRGAPDWNPGIGGVDRDTSQLSHSAT
jgi:hypothetical protein